MTNLTIEQRDAKASLDVLRAAGKIPAVFYGPKEEAMPIAVDAKEFGKVFKEAGESTVVTLSGIGDEKDSMIHEVDYNPVTGGIVHVDFYVIEKGKKVRTHVPLEFIGEAPAVKSLGGTLMKVLHEVEIEAMPKNLPHGIDVDISVLATFDDHIAVKDLRIPDGVEILNNADDTVASVAQPREEEVEEPVVAIDMESIEVEKKGKQEEEGAETSADGEKSAE
ncbi:MAG: 50S ribosomal protein L25 [Candidatus Pacebacteria bacterium]|nr:50S ribosomal protein L25 [Candidatus Paceibacterota bacterium]